MSNTTDLTPPTPKKRKKEKKTKISYSYILINRIGGGMVNVFASSAIDRGFETRSCQTED
jgi:hypothetical protein